MIREVVLDTETTGIGPGHRIVSVGLVEMIDRRQTGNMAEWFCNPERGCDPGAFEAHGLSDRFLWRQPLFKDQVAAIAAFIGDDTIIAHNAPFDRGFLNREIEALKGIYITGYMPAIYPEERWLDSLVMARRKHGKGSQNSLDALCDRYRVDRSRRTYHGALLDASLTAEVIEKMTLGEQGGMTLVGGKIRLENLPDEPFEWKGNPKRITDAERERHASFVAGLGEGAIWHDYQTKP